MSAFHPSDVTPTKQSACQKRTSRHRPIADIRRIADADAYERSAALASGEMNLAVIPAVVALMRAYFDRQAGRISKAKSRIEAIQMQYPDMFEFLDAYYGFLLINERDIEGAHKSFNANLTKLPDKKGDNQRYIELYCRYFIDAGKEDFDWEAIVTEAERLKPDSLTKRLLVLPSKQRLLNSTAT